MIAGVQYKNWENRIFKLKNRETTGGLAVYAGGLVWFRFVFFISVLDHTGTHMWIVDADPGVAVTQIAALRTVMFLFWL